MKIGIISDTHGYIDDRILHYLSSCDEIWHAGDWGSIEVSDALEKINPVIGVYGNIDGADIRKRYPEHQRFKKEGFDIWITHIGGYPGNYDRKVKEKIQSDPPDIFICGHSHILKIMRDKKLGLIHINPGAAGKSGFHKERTLVLMELLNKEIKHMEVVKLGKRN